jgi:hypothetical protein
MIILIKFIESIQKAVLPQIRHKFEVLKSYLWNFCICIKSKNIVELSNKFLFSSETIKY